MTPSDMAIRIERVLARDVTTAGASEIMQILGVPLEEDFLQNIRLYGDTLPTGAHLHPYTASQRLLHFLWDAFDKTPYSLAVDLAIPFRRMLAQRLFSRCGERFICESNVSFNYGHQISLGDDVFFNRSIFIDAKGGVEIGNGACLAEGVRIFTHGHSESLHHKLSYAPVVVNSYAKIYSGVTLLPGVTIGGEAIVAAGALVTKDVPAHAMVAGTPARVVRDRRDEGRHGTEMEHIWLADGQFQ